PFENLSPDPDNAYFANGVQDEILTRLASIADLKVISRTSVMQYKSGVARDLRKIGNQLGVARGVEGGGQRVGSRVRVNAQLLEAADLLNQAVARDPSFFKAYCLLASTHDRLYFLGRDHTPARLALAEAAVQEAFRLHPDAGEAHLARAQNLYRGYLDYNAA